MNRASFDAEMASREVIFSLELSADSLMIKIYSCFYSDNLPTSFNVFLTLERMSSETINENPANPAPGSTSRLLIISMPSRPARKWLFFWASPSNCKKWKKRILCATIISNRIKLCFKSCGYWCQADRFQRCKSVFGINTGLYPWVHRHRGCCEWSL